MTCTPRKQSPQWMRSRLRRLLYVSRTNPQPRTPRQVARAAQLTAAISLVESNA